MNGYVITVLTVLFIFNLLGVGLYHYQWKHDEPYKNWKCKDFYLWTAYLFLCGIAYVILRGILKIVSLFRKK